MVVNSTECQAPSGDFGFSRDFVQSLGADVGSAERHAITHLALQSCEMLYERAGSVCIGVGNWIVLVSLLVSEVLFASDTSSENVRFWPRAALR